MTDKHSIKYGAYIDKESGNMVCQQLNCNYSIQVYDMAQNMSAIYINTSPNPQSQIEFFANNSTNTQSTTYSNCNLGINENNFYLYNMNGGTIWNTDLLTNVSTFYMPITITGTLTANNVSITGQLNLNDMILADPSNGFQLYGNDAQGYPTINFYTGSPSSGTLQYSMGVYNDIWYVIPNGGSQALQVSSDMGVNMPYSVSVCDGNGTFTCDGEATFNATLTASIIVPTAANTGTIGTNSLSFYNSYFDTSNIGHAYIGFIDTLVYMQNGASFYGPINILNPVTGDAVFTLTVNNSNQLNFESAGQTAPLTIDSGSNTLNLPSDLIASGTVTANTINTTIITNPSGTSGTINVTGNVSLSTLSASTINTTIINPNIIDMNTPLATLTSPLGTGTIYWFQPYQGTAYKKVIAYFVGYENDTTTATVITFTTAFTTLGSITSNTTNGLSTASGGGLSLTNTELSIDPNNTTVYTGIIVIEGF